MISSIIDSIKGNVSVKVQIKGNRKLSWTKMKVSNASAKAAIDDVIRQKPTFGLVKENLRIKLGRKGSWCTYESLPPHAPCHKQHITIISLDPHRQRRVQNDYVTHNTRLVHHHQNSRIPNMRGHQGRNPRVYQHTPSKIEVTIEVNNKVHRIEINSGTNLKKVCRVIIERTSGLHLHLTEFKFYRQRTNMASGSQVKTDAFGKNWKLFYHLPSYATLSDDTNIKCRLLKDVPVETDHCRLCGALGGGGCPPGCEQR